MAKPKPPRIDPHDIPKVSDDELDRLLEKLFFVTLNSKRQVESGKLNEAWIAFEALGSIFPGLEAGLTHKDACSAYPFPDWRENTVEVPVAIIKEIVSGWNEFLNSETKNLGQAYGFEQLNRQGRHSMKKKWDAIGRKLMLAGQVEALYRQVGDEQPRSLADVCLEVAQGEGVSTDTVSRAYKEYRAVIDENVKLMQGRV